MQFTANVVLKYSATKTKSTKPNRRSDIRQSSLCLSFLKQQSTLSFLCCNDSVCLKILEINYLWCHKGCWVPPDQPASGPVTTDPERQSSALWVISKKVGPKESVEAGGWNPTFSTESCWTFSCQDLQFLIFILFYFVLFCRGRSVFVFVFLQCCLAGRGLTRRRKRSEKWNSWKPKYLAIKECTQYIRVLVSTSRSDFHNTDLPDLSERGTRSSLGSFPVIRAAVVMLWVPVWKAEESESQWAHSWCFVERMIDHRKWLTVSVLFITKESYKRKEVRKRQEVVLIFQLLSELPTYFRWRLAGSRLLSKVWLQHCSSNKWKEPLPPVFHECEGVRAFPGQIFHFGPWNMNKRKLSKFCFTLWRCCFGVCLVNMWQMRNQTSYGQQMIFIFFFLSYFNYMTGCCCCWLLLPKSEVC